MKTIIVYDTKTGTSGTCAEMLEKKLEADISNLSEGATPDISNYELVIIGGGIYAGKYTPKLRKFIRNSAESLKARKFAFFVCCAGEDDYAKNLPGSIPVELLNKAAAVECFGYGVDVEKAKGFMTKMVTKIMKKAFEKEGKPLCSIKENKIEAFAAKLKS
ncbi:MAG: flavodoxin domain-containing protein [Clostridia bacterium]|nr:flavodoxin domain-containing protein [Clostridia bacterium]